MKSECNDKENDSHQSQLWPALICGLCKNEINDKKGYFTWKKVNFCNLVCLARYQNEMNCVEAKTSSAKVKSNHIEVILKPPKTPRVANVATICKPLQNDQSSLIKPISLNKKIQTNDGWQEKVFVPIPVLNYVPVPLAAYVQTAPYLIPFPVPFPVPIFIQNDEQTENEQLHKTGLPTATDSSGGLGHSENPYNANLFEGVFIELEDTDAQMCLKYTYGVNAFNNWASKKETILNLRSFKLNLSELTSERLNHCLCAFIQESRKPSGGTFEPDTFYYLCLGIQYYLHKNDRTENIFFDPYYEQFTDILHELIKSSFHLYNDTHFAKTRVEEEHLWESEQLGAYTPTQLLNTLIFFHTKYFRFMTVESHMKMGFPYFVKHLSKNHSPNTAEHLLRYYVPPTSVDENNFKHISIHTLVQNTENCLRCPITLLEFYLSKCPESVKTRNDIFYLQPEKHWTSDSPLWYTPEPVPEKALEKMLYRILMVKEVIIARFDL